VERDAAQGQCRRRGSEAEPGVRADILIYGSGKLVNSLMAHNVSTSTG
jgi:hypothetical protein